MHNPKIIKQYREQLLTLHAVTVSIVSLVEIIGYIIFVSLGIQKLSFKDAYLWQGVIIPIIINAVAHFGARAVVKSETAKAERQNASVIYAAFVTAFVVSFFHRDYIVALCAFVFPIILSAMYNDKKLLKRGLWISLASLTVTVVALYIENKLELTGMLNVMILYGFVVISLTEAIRKATSMPAEVYRFRNKGLIREGYDADICIFNADTIIDRAEYVNCHERCVGLSYVILGGEVVVKDAVFCGNKKGGFIPDEERFDS